MLLVLLPVTVLLSFTAFAAMAQWEEARTLSDFDTAIEVSSRPARSRGAVARERIAAVEARLSAGPDTLRGRAEAQRITDQRWAGLGEAVDRQPEPDVAGVLDAVRRQLHALRVQTSTGSLDAHAVTRRYEAIEDKVLDIVAVLESGRPTRASGRAADAHMAMLRAVAAAESERAELAILFHTPGDEAHHRRRGPLDRTGEVPAQKVPADRLGRVEGRTAHRDLPGPRPRGPQGP